MLDYISIDLESDKNAEYSYYGQEETTRNIDLNQNPPNDSKPLNL